MKFYKRDLEGYNSIQILCVRDGNIFHSIRNKELGPHTTWGFLPNEFEVGKNVPYGFYRKFSFKRYTPSDTEMEFMSLDEGNFTGGLN